MKKRIFFVLGLLMAVVVQAQTYWNGTSNKVFSGSGTNARTWTKKTSPVSISN